MCVAWCHRCVWAAKCGYVTTLGAHALTPAPPRGVKDPFLDVRPEVLEPMRRQLGVAHRVLDVLVTEVRLQRLGVVASIGQGITTLSCPHTSMAPSHTHRWHIPKHDAGSADAVSSSIEGGVDRCPMAAQRSVAAPHWPAAACSKGLD